MVDHNEQTEAAPTLLALAVSLLLGASTLLRVDAHPALSTALAAAGCLTVAWPLAQAATLPEDQRRRLWRYGSSLVLAIGPLAWLGTALLTQTHHRPLGAATFSVAALATIAAAMLAGLRLHELSRHAGVPGRIAKAAFWIALAGSLALGAIYLLPAVRVTSPWIWLDILLLAGLGLVARRRLLAPRLAATLRRPAAAAAVLLMVTGVLMLPTGASAEVSSHAPVLLGLMWLGV